jgi:branched-chain amino acid transport system permease protein
VPAFVQWFVVSLLNGISVGPPLFMLSAGLTLIFGMMGVYVTNEWLSVRR